MKKFWIASILMMGILSCKTQKELNNKITGNYAAQWEQIDDNIKKGFPEKAIAGLDSLIEEAKKNEDHTVATRGILRKINLKNLDQQDFMKDQMPYVQKVLAETTDPISASFLNYTQALIYQNYWESNQSQIPTQSSGDEEWDGSKYKETIEQLMNNALSEESKSVAIKDVNEFFSEIAYDPSMMLWDFFQLEKIRISKSNVYSKLLGEEVHRSRVAQFYDKLITKLKSQKQHKLQIETEIAKQLYGNFKFRDVSINIPKEYLYVLDYYQGAELLQEAQQSQDNRSEQSTLYQLSLEKFEKVKLSSDTVYQNNAQVNIERITSQELQVSVEEVVVPNKKSLAVLTSRNLKKVYVKIYELNKEDYLANRRDKGYPYKGKPIAYEGEFTLPKATFTYTSQSTEIPIPELAAGFYGIVVNTIDDFKIAENNPLFQSNFLVSNLSINSYYNQASLQMNLECIDRTTGERINGADFKIFDRKYDRRNDGQNLFTIYKGKADPVFSYTPSQNQNYYPFVEANGQYFMNNNGLYQNDYRNRANYTANLLTDRAIYRPGQKVHFQGILYHVSPERTPKIQANIDFTIDINDNFGNKLETIRLKSDEFGAFDGDFEIDEGTQNGYLNFQFSSKAMRIDAYTSVKVEEYKRPKYEITFEDISQELKLGEIVKVSAEAIGYTGVPVANAKVTYKIYRSAWWPYFYRGYRSYFPPGASEKALIKTGTIKSSALGKIDFNFIAEKSLSSPDLKNYNYEVEVEVVDNSGETKTESKSFNITEQKVFIKFEETEKEGTYSISTVNADGQAIPASVKIDILKKEDNSFKTKRYWDYPDASLASAIDFPGFSFLSEDMQYSSTVYTASLDVKDTVEINLKDILGGGSFKIQLKTEDDPEVSQKFEILDFGTNEYGSDELFNVEKIASEYSPGESLNFRIGSSVAGLRVHVQKYRDNRFVNEEWKTVDGSILITDLLSEKDYGGYSYVIRGFYKNRVYDKVVNVNIPWRHKDLVIKPKSIRYITEPGAPEKWTFIVTDKDGNPVKSRFLSSMYDASLDQFQPHNWGWNLYPTYLGTPYHRNYSYNSKMLYTSNYSWNRNATSMRPFIIAPIFGYSPLNYAYYGRPQTMSRRKGVMRSEAEPIMMESSAMEMDGEASKSEAKGQNIEGNAAAPPSPPPAPPSNVRTNLSELVFFYPDLKTNDEGEVSIEFTNNEALTRWKLQNFAFTQDLKYGFSSEEIITKKELMIQANQPRFLRSGDKIFLSAKLINLSERDQTVDASLVIFDEIRKENIDINSEKKGIIIKEGEQKDVIWEVNVPDDVEFVRLTYSVSGEKHEDAEQHSVPVVPNQIFLIDSETILLDAKARGKIDVQAMLSGNKRTSALTIESTGSPAWYAVRSLPYLMENKNENSEAVFNRYFANALALKILNENPLVEKYYKEWEEKGNLKSQLSLNSELKKVDLKATPWLEAALSEEESMARMADFFDRTKVEKELKLAMQKLKAMQDPSGGFPWYQGGRLNYYMSQYVLEGFLRLKELGLGEVDSGMQSRLYSFCANEAMKRDWKKEDKVPSILIKNAWINQVLGENVSVSYSNLIKDIRSALKDKWYEYGLADQVYIAKIFKKENRAFTDEIAASLLEKSFYKEQLGRFWNSNNQMVFSSWDIDLQASMISLFNELGGHDAKIDEMKFWLITNKRTNNWRSNIATSSAIYALSLGTSSSFSEGLPIQTSLDGNQLESQAVVGINYEKISFNEASEIAKIKEIVFVNPNENKAWANVHHQFFQKYEDVERTENAFLDIKKEIYRVGLNDELENVASKDLNLGDRIRVRLIIEVDRPMQFVHVSDDRPGGAEPVDTKSGYQWGNRLSYYLSVKDLGTHFFVDYLNKGRHVIEYDMFINNLGEFNSGVAEIQNMYAPEFNDYSKSVGIKVVK